MILKNRDIYEKVAQKYAMDVKLIESVGDFILKELIDNLNSPTEISYELPKLGSWDLRQEQFAKNLKKMNHTSQAVFGEMIEKIYSFKDLKRSKRKLRRNVTRQKLKESSQNKLEEY